MFSASDLVSRVWSFEICPSNGLGEEELLASTQEGLHALSARAGT